MTEAKGTAQTTRSGHYPNDTARAYCGRWVSPPIVSGPTSVAANTWTLNFAAMGENIGVGETQFPCLGANQPIHVNLYVWRPSNSTKVGTVKDGLTNSDFNEPNTPDTEQVMHGTFTGSAVSGITANDVLILEIWSVSLPNSSTDDDIAIFFDGTTENITDNATVTNHAAYLETPQTDLFGAATTTVTQTSIHKYNLLRNITQTTIQKYNLRKFLAQTSIHEYNLRVLVAVTTSIHKYRLLQQVLQTTIHKYRMSGILLVTSIQKYNLKRNILQTTIQKYNLKRNVAQTSIHKYKIVQQILVTSIHKYKMSGVLLVTTIQKYNLRRYISQTNIHKYNLRIFVAILNSIQKYNLRKSVPQTTIQKYSMRSYVTQASIQKYNVGAITSTNMTETSSKTYANKFITKV